MDAEGTSPRMGEGRTMQEQLSRATQEQLPRSVATKQSPEKAIQHEIASRYARNDRFPKQGKVIKHQGKSILQHKQ